MAERATPRGAGQGCARHHGGRQTGMRILIEINRGTWTEVWGNRLVLCFVERWEGPRRVPQAGTVSPQHWRLAGGSLGSPSMETPLSTMAEMAAPCTFLTTAPTSHPNKEKHLPTNAEACWFYLHQWSVWRNTAGCQASRKHCQEGMHG